MELLQSLHDGWHKILIVYLVVERLVERIKKFQAVERFVERRLRIRRKEDMINPIEIMKDVNLAVTTVEKVKAALPMVNKLAADIKLAVADKQDSTKLEADLTVLLTDIENDLQTLAALFPKAA